MLFPRHVVVRTLVFAAALAGGLALVAPPAAADAIADQIKAMKDFEKAGDAGKCIAKMEELKDSSDPAVTAAFKSLAGSKNDEVACAAMKKVAMTKKDPEFLKTLVGKIDDKDLRDRKDGRPKVYMCVLECVGAYKSKTALAQLEKVVDKFLSTDGDYATRAIAAYGSVPELAVVDQLLKWLKSADAHGQSQGGKNESAEARDNKAKASTKIIETLNALTGQDLGDAATWEKWWENNRKTFKFPDPNKKEPEVDWAALKEYADPSYNYTVKRPDGGGWHFQPKDQYCRARINLVGEDKVEMGRVDWRIHNTTSMTPKDIKGLADWFITKGLIDEISEFTATGQPKLEDHKMAGREWLLVTAKGMGQGNRAGWGSMERRVYMTKCDYMGAPHLILYADVVLRNGMEDADKKKLFDSVEAVVLKVTEK
jgi:hypothetical protein